jgi:hypothetical protein
MPGKLISVVPAFSVLPSPLPQSSLHQSVAPQSANRRIRRGLTSDWIFGQFGSDSTFDGRKDARLEPPESRAVYAHRRRGWRPTGLVTPSRARTVRFRTPPIRASSYLSATGVTEDA